MLFSSVRAEGVGCKLTLEEKIEFGYIQSVNNARQTRKLIYQKGLKEKKWNEVGVEKLLFLLFPSFTGLTKRLSVSKTLVQDCKRKRTVTTAENMQLVAEEISRYSEEPPPSLRYIR